MIIDRGKVVANGTPAELRRKSEWAGAVTLRVNGVAAGAVQEKLNHLRAAKRATATATGNRVTATVFPRKAGDGDLTREVIEATSGWQVEELRTEEGRLDEVFRSITMPDTSGKGDRNQMNALATSRPSRNASCGRISPSPVAYVFIVIFLLLNGFFTFMVGGFFERGQASLTDSFFDWHPWFYLFLVPAVGHEIVGG